MVRPKPTARKHLNENKQHWDIHLTQSRKDRQESFSFFATWRLRVNHFWKMCQFRLPRFSSDIRGLAEKAFSQAAPNAPAFVRLFRHS